MSNLKTKTHSKDTFATDQNHVTLSRVNLMCRDRKVTKF